MIIRNEKTDDYRVVEEMIKETFWNLSVPGCNEHYFAHLVRNSEDFIPELDFVLEEDGKIIGSIIYVKAKLVAMDGTEKEILSFGPFTIHPDYQRKGYGRKLLEHSLEAARKLGFDTIAIWGNPENYACYGFKNCKRYNVCIDKDVYPVALMVKVLDEDALEGKCGNMLKALHMRWMRVALKNLIVLLSRWKKAINIHKSCFTFIQDRMYYDSLLQLKNWKLYV